MLCLFFRHVLDKLFVIVNFGLIILWKPFVLLLFNSLKYFILDLRFFKKSLNRYMVQERSDRIPLLMYLVTTLIITLSLFFVDEGFYSFRWMQSWGNWFVFFIYGSAIYAGHLVVFLIANRVFKWRINNMAVILIGASLAVFLLATLIFA